jgi:hypothetical protein
VIKAMLDMQFRYFLWSNTQVPPQGDTSTEKEEDDKSYFEGSSSDPEEETNDPNSCATLNLKN